MASHRPWWRNNGGWRWRVWRDGCTNLPAFIVEAQAGHFVISQGDSRIGTMAAPEAAAAEAAAAAFPFGTVVVTSPSFVSGTSCARTSSTSASASARRVGPLAHLAGTLPPHVRVLGTSDPYGGEL